MDIYWIQDKQRRGPATVPDIVSLIQMGEITPDTKGWHTGVQGWKPLRELPALVDFLNDAPARPAAPAAPVGTIGTPGIEAPERTQPFPAPQPPTGGASDGRAEGEPGGRSPKKPGPPPLPDYVMNAPDKAEPGPEGARQAGLDLQDAGLPAAWMRLLARLVDTMLYLAAGMGVLYAFGEPFDSVFSPCGPYSCLFWLPMILLEAYSLSTWGTTPGKKMLGICVCTFGPDKGLTFGRAFTRSFFVFVMGMGMMLSIIPVITMLISLWLLRSRGICWWDFRASTLPVRKHSPRPVQVVFACCALHFLFTLIYFFMLPWEKPMLEEIAKASPETARMLAPLLNEDTPPGDAAGKTAPVQELLGGLVPPAPSAQEGH